MRCPGLRQTSCGQRLHAVAIDVLAIDNDVPTLIPSETEFFFLRDVRMCLRTHFWISSAQVTDRPRCNSTSARRHH